MGHKFHELVTEALSVERELRALTPDKPSLRCFISECLRGPTPRIRKSRRSRRVWRRNKLERLRLRRIHQTLNARNRKRPPPGASGEGANRQDVF